MIASVCKWIDRLAINYAASHMPKPDGRDLHLEEARRLLQCLDLSQAHITAAGIQFHGSKKYQFATARPSAHAVNNVARGQFYQCGGDWRQKPAVVLLHGWNDRLNHYYFFDRQARLLNDLGLSAATLQLPWHFDRRPPELGAWGDFLNADLLHTVEAILQAMGDIRSLVNWLLEQGCPVVGLWGVSMGAWLAGLTVCDDSRIGCAVLTVPVARIDRLIQEAIFCETIRAALHGQPVTLDRLNLTHQRPVIPKENILLVEAEHDLFVPRETVEELWLAWDKPEIRRVLTAHISVLFKPGLAKWVAHWIAAKAGGRAGK